MFFSLVLVCIQHVFIYTNIPCSTISSQDITRGQATLSYSIMTHDIDYLSPEEFLHSYEGVIVSSSLPANLLISLTQLAYESLHEISVVGQREFIIFPNTHLMLESLAQLQSVFLKSHWCQNLVINQNLIRGRQF